MEEKGIWDYAKLGVSAAWGFTKEFGLMIWEQLGNLFDWLKSKLSGTPETEQQNQANSRDGRRAPASHEHEEQLRPTVPVHRDLRRGEGRSYP